MRIALVVLPSLPAASLAGQQTSAGRAWNAPVAPFKYLGTIYSIAAAAGARTGGPTAFVDPRQLLVSANSSERQFRAALPAGHSQT